MYVRYFLTGFLLLFAIGYGSPQFICIDGGGTKTEFQVLDAKGKPLSIDQGSAASYALVGGSTNINTQGSEQVREVLHGFFENATLGQQRLSTDLSRCEVVAGLAGILTEEQHEAVTSLFKEMGVDEKNLHLMTDAGIALESLEGDGAVLISGTGSICLGKRGGETYQVGGLGKILSDEGSGYYIGLQALKASLAEEYGWGQKTALTPALRRLYQTDRLRTMIQPITRCEISPGKIAKAAPLVFEAAGKDDPKAKEIVKNAAGHLRDMLLQLLALAELSQCEVHVWGGLFKGPEGDKFFKKVFNHPAIHQKKVRAVNKAHGNAATVYVQKKLIQGST